jgi:hypothetical protein
MEINLKTGNVNQQCAPNCSKKNVAQLLQEIRHPAAPRKRHPAASRKNTQLFHNPRNTATQLPQEKRHPTAPRKTSPS